jgi:hypothetical protein
MSAMQAVRQHRRIEIDLFRFMVWAYQKQQVVAETGRSLADVEAALEDPRQGMSRDGVAAALRIAELGCHVDGGPATAIASRCHPDAERLHAVVLSLPAVYARAIIDAATSGDPPEPCDVPRTWRRQGFDGRWYPVKEAPEPPRNRFPITFHGRVCHRLDGWHYEMLDGGAAMVWSPYCVVFEHPVTTAYVDLSVAIAENFAAGKRALDAALETVEFEDYAVLPLYCG